MTACASPPPGAPTLALTLVGSGEPLLRIATIRQANEFLDSGHPQVVVYDQSSLQAIETQGEGLLLTLHGPHGEDILYGDGLIGATGFEADASLYRELQIHQCYASGAPTMPCTKANAGAASGSPSVPMRNRNEPPPETHA